MAGRDDLSGETKVPAAGQEERPGTAKVGEASPDPSPDRTPPEAVRRIERCGRGLSDVGDRFVRVTDGKSAQPNPGSEVAANPQRVAKPAAAAKPERQPSERSTGKPAMDSATPAGAVKEEDLLEIEPEGPEKSVKEWSVAPSQVDYEDPLLTCLSLVAGLLERPISREALKSGLPRASEQFTPELAIRAADRAGLTAKVMRRPKLDQILAVSLPCILLLKASNACVLIGYPDSNTAEVVVAEGGGARTLPIDELEAQYTGHAIFLRPEFKFDARASDIRLSNPRRWFWGTLAQFWPIYSHVLLASIMINAFAIASPLFIMNVYDRVVPNNAVETLWVLAIGVATVFTFEFIMRNMRTYFVDVAGKNADIIIASRLLERVMAMRLDQKPPSTGALANNQREF